MVQMEQLISELFLAIPESALFFLHDTCGLPNCLGSSLSNTLWCCTLITLSYMLGYNGLIPSFTSAAFRQPSTSQESELGLREEENSGRSSANF